MKLSKEVEKNVKFLKKSISSDDVEYLDFKVGNVPAVLVFIKNTADIDALGKLILSPASDFKGKVTEKSLNSSFLSPERKTVLTVEETADEICSGQSVFIVEGFNKAYSFPLKKTEKRAITEPPTSTVIKGPREGFVESLPVNINLMRKRIKSPSLTVINMKIGKYSKTDIAIMFVKGIADENLVKTLKERLNGIDIDAVLDSSYISKFLGVHRSSLFKQVGNTEKPDILTAKILEGRVAVLVDGTPIVLTIPYLLIEDFQSPSDYYNSSYSATISRFLRLFSVMLSLLLPAFYVAAELFHLQLLPLSFLLTIVNSIKGIPLSPSYEMFFTLLIFEILNEASVRMPKYVGMVVSIVGGLVLGETAVNAGILSAPTLMIIAFSGICLYTVPELEQSFSVIRIIYLMIGGSVGGYCLLLAVAFTFVYVVTFENFGTPLFAPFSPLIVSDLKDSLYRGLLVEQRHRPLSLGVKNKIRLSKKEKN